MTGWLAGILAGLPLACSVLSLLFTLLGCGEGCQNVTSSGKHGPEPQGRLGPGIPLANVTRGLGLGEEFSLSLIDSNLHCQRLRCENI